MNQKPKIADDIEINLVEDGYVIYQGEKDRVHYLNHTAVMVLESCTGENTIAEIIDIVQKLYELSEPPEKQVNECLDSMFKEELVR